MPKVNPLITISCYEFDNFTDSCSTVEVARQHITCHFELKMTFIFYVFFEAKRYQKGIKGYYNPCLRLLVDSVGSVLMVNNFL
jgi:hypothetical protein